MKSIAILHLGRHQALGEQRRVASWASIVSAMGATPLEVPLLQDHRARLGDWRSLGAVAAGEGVPESLAWDSRSLMRSLELKRPDAVITVTVRAFDRRVSARWPTLLDYVDVLSRSYRDRGTDGGRFRSIGWNVLGSAHRRVERVGPHDPASAAGVEDARALGVRWVPNVIQPAPANKQAPTHDIVFLGNLAYFPNRQSLGRLVQISRLVRRSRDEVTVLVGGANPDRWVRDLCRDEGWDLHGPFADPIDFVRRGRVAVAPLSHAAGIQNKVLEAAAAGVAQVISPAAAAGLPPDPPVRVADDDESFAAAIESLLAREGHTSAGPSWIRDNFSAERWAHVVRDLFLAHTYR